MVAWKGRQHEGAQCLELLAPAAQVNPFGDAKPVDADAKLREIEERMHKRKVRGIVASA